MEMRGSEASASYEAVPRDGSVELELDERPQHSQQSKGISKQDFDFQGAPVGLFDRLGKRRLLAIAGGAVLTLLILVGLFSTGSGEKIRKTLALDTDGLESVLGDKKTQLEDGFTLVAPTYKRLESLPEFLNNYASGNVTSLRRIILLWNDIDNPPPQSFLDSLDSYKTPVIVEQRHINSLNQRFHKSENVKTHCVLAIDDDMTFWPSDIELGYQVWNEFGQGRKRMVGYIPREAAQDKSYLAEAKDLKTYSMVLTKSAFFHTDWMDLYWSTNTTITALRDYVQEHNNCEDILMAFLHAHYTRVPPIWVDAKFVDGGTKKGISTKPGHIPARTACVRHFAEALGQDTLVSTSYKVSPLRR